MLPNRQKFGWQQNIQAVVETIGRNTLSTYFDSQTTNDTQFLAERLVSDIACNHDELDEAVFSMISTAINTTPTVSHSRASSENTSSPGMLVEGLNTVTSTLASAAATAANALGQVVHGLTTTNSSASALTTTNLSLIHI